MMSKQETLWIRTSEELTQDEMTNVMRQLDEVFPDRNVVIVPESTEWMDKEDIKQFLTDLCEHYEVLDE